MEIVHPPVADYLESLLPDRPDAMKEMEAIARRHSFPIIGPLVGNFLAQQAALIGAKRIMELGSGYGYSAAWFSRVLPPGGKIICTDGDQKNKTRAEGHFSALGISESIEFRVGDALTVFGEIEGNFDFIFCDIDKHGYPDAFRAALPRVRSGGILAFDNALWSGRMLEGDASADTKGVSELNRLAFAEPTCRASIVPLRDGVLVCVKN